MSYLGPKIFIDLKRLSNNYQLLVKEIKDLSIMATVKANAYGHGAIEVSKTLEKEGVRYLAVFTIDEAIELRKAGIKSDIFIYSKMDPKRIDEAQKNNLTLNVSSFEDLKTLDNFSGRIKGHLKFDTGMTRLGVPFDKAEEFLKKAKKISSLEIEGLYSHFATADEGDLSYATNQLKKFNKVLDFANHLKIKAKFIHCSNSGAILNLPNSRFNMVRAGMLLYGAFPSDDVPQDLSIEPVMTFTAPVVEVRDVKKGTLISYGGAYETKKDTKIAVIQAGFADGVPRPWYINGYVLFKNQKMKITGRICMDQLMIDIKDSNIAYGDEVLIFGSNDNGTIDINEIAEKIDSTSYVIVTSVGIRPKRIHKK